MGKGFLIIVLVLFASISSAQSIGGEVLRKSKTNKNVVRKGHSSNHDLASTTVGIINRNIGGVILGKSTKQDVINMLKKKNIRYENESVVGTPAISYYNKTPFGGITWDYCSYEFFKNRVFVISYVKAVRSGTTKEIIESEHSMLTDQLLRKYKECYITKEKRGDMDSFKIEDGRTVLEVEKGIQGSTFLMSIFYRDFDLSIEEINKNHDEL